VHGEAISCRTSGCSTKCCVHVMTPVPATTTAQPLVIGQAGSAQLMAISLSASFTGFARAHEMNRWLEGVAALAVAQDKERVEFVKGQISLKLVKQFRILEIMFRRLGLT
jgi:hypothetical protein